MPEFSCPPPSLPRWQPVALAGLYLDDPLRTLIASRDSLTLRLARLFDAPIMVTVHAQGPDRARPDELSALGLPAGQRIWRREVTLEAKGEVLVAARSVMAIHHCPPWMNRLGTRALGHQLFARAARSPRKSSVQRSPIDMSRSAPGFLGLPAVWGRRSLFALGTTQPTLLVQEYFVHETFVSGRR